MLLETIVAIGFVTIIGVTALYLFPSNVKNKRALKEFDHLLRAVRLSEDMKELEQCEMWFCDFLEDNKLTQEEVKFYEKEFLHAVVNKMSTLKVF